MSDFPRVQVQVAWTTEPRTRPADADWTTISDSSGTNRLRSLSVDRGLDVKRNTIEAGTCRLSLDNEDQAFDPSNTSSTYSPNVKPRKRVRVRAQLAALDLDGTGDYASTPDAAALDITADIDIRVRVAADDWTPAANQVLLSKFNGLISTGGGYQLQLQTTGVLRLRWSTGAANLSADSTVDVGATDGDARWLRVTLDVNDGGGNRVIRFYTSTDATPDHSAVSWTQLGATVTTAGTTSIGNASYSLFVGADVLAASGFAGQVFAAAVLNGIASSEAAEVRFEGQHLGNGTVRGETGETWTLAGNATVANVGTTFDLFTGFVERWPIRWQVADGWVDVTASDLFALIADDVMPKSVIEHEILGDSPVHYWPLSESSFFIADDMVGSSDGTYLKSASPDDSLLPYDGGQAQAFGYTNNSDDAQRMTANGVTVPTYPLTIEHWARSLPDTDEDGIPKVFISLPTIEVSWQGAIGSGLGSGYQIDINDGAFTALATTPIPNSSSYAHHFVWTYDVVGGVPTATFWINGVQITDLYTTTDGGSLNPATTGTMTIMPDTARLGQWAIQHLAIYDQALTSTQIIDHYEAAMDAWDGDTTGERLARCLDIAGIDAGDRNIATGIETCGPTVPNRMNMLQYLRKIAATENGPLYVAPDGKVTFPGQLSDTPTIQATFSDDGADTPYIDITPDYSIDRLINSAGVRRELGNVQDATDTASIDAYGMAHLELETLHRTPSGARALASSLVVRNHEPKTVVESLTVDGRDDDVNVADMLGLDIGDAVNIEADPPGAGDTLDQDGYVERVAHRMNDKQEWGMTFGVAEFVTLPAFAWDTANQGWDESVWT